MPWVGSLSPLPTFAIFVHTGHVRGLTDLSDMCNLHAVHALDGLHSDLSDLCLLSLRLIIFVMISLQRCLTFRFYR